MDTKVKKYYAMVVVTVDNEVVESHMYDAGHEGHVHADNMMIRLAEEYFGDDDYICLEDWEDTAKENAGYFSKNGSVQIIYLSHKQDNTETMEIKKNYRTETYTLDTGTMILTVDSYACGVKEEIGGIYTTKDSVDKIICKRCLEGWDIVSHHGEYIGGLLVDATNRKAEMAEKERKDNGHELEWDRKRKEQENGKINRVDSSN